LIARFIGKPRHVVECAAFRPETCFAESYMDDADRVQLFEPQPNAFKLLEDAYGDRKNVELHNCAIHDKPGELKLMLRSTRFSDGSSYVQGVHSPSIANFRKFYKYPLTVPCKRFDEFDDGTIDFLLLDTEGCEWFVLKHMVSRPILIQVEMAWQNYRNPYFDEIEAWMKVEGYEHVKTIRSDRCYARERGELSNLSGQVRPADLEGSASVP
jgi:FkbM family methyltransferase